MSGRNKEETIQHEKLHFRKKMFCDLQIYLHTYSIYAHFKLYIRDLEKNITEGNTPLYEIRSHQKKMYSDLEIFR